jgi:hypothetical protein
VAEQPRSRNAGVENDPSPKDRAEEPRDNVNVETGGISDRPLPEENENQERLPPRHESNR